MAIGLAVEALTPPGLQQRYDSESLVFRNDIGKLNEQSVCGTVLGMEELGQAAAFKGAGMKILIVEDEILQAEILTRMLRSWEHEVVSVDSGQQALDRLERDAPDLILLDVFLPDTTAMELIPQLKAIQPDARIITLTGYSNRELERKLRELGISYYMAKPFQRDELHSILVHLAGRPSDQGRSRTTNPIINPT